MMPVLLDLKDVTKVKNIRIHRMQIHVITVLFVEYWMRIPILILRHVEITSTKRKSIVNFLCLIYDQDRKHVALPCVWNERLRTSCTHAAPVAVLSDKWEIFRLFAFDREASNYPTNIEYARSGQYSNVVEFEFELRHIPKDLSVFDLVIHMFFKMYV